MSKTDGSIAGVIRYLKGTVMSGHLWLVAGFLVAVFWHAFSSPGIAISAPAVEVVLGVVALAGIGAAARATNERADRFRN